MVEYSKKPEELLRQLMPTHSQITLKARYWNQEEDYVLFYMMRDGQQVQWDSGQAVLYLHNDHTHVSLDWTGGESKPKFLLKAMEHAVLAAADAAVASLSFTLVLKEDKGYAFTLKNNGTDLPAGLVFPDAFSGYWITFLPRDSKEGTAYMAAGALQRREEARTTAQPDTSAADFENAIAALAA